MSEIFTSPQLSYEFEPVALSIFDEVDSVIRDL